MARRNVVRIEGLEQLRRALNEAARDVEDQKEVLGDVAQYVAEESAHIVPKLSGALERTIRPITSKSAATVRAGGGSVDYAGVIHFGWPGHNIEPVPFMYDVIDRRRDEIMKRYEAGIDRIIGRI